MIQSSPQRAAIYTRVSSDEQTKGYGLEYQLEDSKRAIEQHGHRLIAVYSDPGVSGTVEDRPGLNQLRHDARAGRFDILYVWKSDRLARDELLQLTLYRELRSQGMEVHSVTEPNMNDLMRGIYAVFGAEDLRSLKTKMYSGRLRAMRDGKWIGPTPYGYSKDKRTFKLRVNPKEATALQQLFCWFVDDRLTLTRLARRAQEHAFPTRYDVRKQSKPRNGPGFWSKGVLRRFLTREYYATGVAWFRPRLRTGDVHHQDEPIPIGIPALVPSDVFAAAQRQLLRNRVHARRRRIREYLFLKKLRCGYCGRRLTGVCRTDREDAKFYRADAWTERRCPHCRYYLERDLEQAVWQNILNLFRNPERFLPALDAYRARGSKRSALERELQTIQTLEAKAATTESALLGYELEGFYSAGVLASKRAELTAQRQRLAARQDDISKLLIMEDSRAATIASAKQLYARLHSELDDADYSTK